MLKRIKQLFKPSVKPFQKPPVPEQQLAADRVVTAAMHYASELARQKSSLTGTPATMPRAVESAAVAPALEPGDIHAENNAEIDRVLEQKRGSHVLVTRHSKIIDLKIIATS